MDPQIVVDGGDGVRGDGEESRRVADEGAGARKRVNLGTAARCSDPPTHVTDRDRDRPGDRGRPAVDAPQF